MTDRRSDIPTDTARCRVACPWLKTNLSIRWWGINDYQMIVNWETVFASPICFLSRQSIAAFGSCGWTEPLFACSIAKNNLTPIGDARWQRTRLNTQLPASKDGRTDGPMDEPTKRGVKSRSTRLRILIHFRAKVALCLEVALEIWNVKFDIATSLTKSGRVNGCPSRVWVGRGTKRKGH